MLSVRARAEVHIMLEKDDFNAHQLQLNLFFRLVVYADTANE
jgi:hypothetical protein